MAGYFSKGVFDFLRELEANNEKAWWEDNKDRYLKVIREPALDFIADFGDRLQTISPHFRADTRVNGGSLMRPYRDVRFSKDKTPYKTNVGIQFRHALGKDVHAPGFYLHLQPGECFAGVGMWAPEPKVAKVIRQQIHDQPQEWSEVAHGTAFSEVWNIAGDDAQLKRIPRDFDAESHPHPNDLRLKSFIASRRLTQRDVTSSTFADDLIDDYSVAGPFTAFLCDAMGVAF